MCVHVCVCACVFNLLTPSQENTLISSTFLAHISILRASSSSTTYNTMEKEQTSHISGESKNRQNPKRVPNTATYRNTPQHTATHCNKLQQTEKRIHVTSANKKKSHCTILKGGKRQTHNSNLENNHIVRCQNTVPPPHMRKNNKHVVMIQRRGHFGYTVGLFWRCT